MRVCLVSSSFFPAISYGGPISATWNLSRMLAKKGVEVFVSTTNANGNRRLNNVSRYQHEEIIQNLWVRYYHEEVINLFSFSLLFNIWKDIKQADIVYIQYIFHYSVIVSLLFSWLYNKKVIICPRGSFSSYTLNNKKNILKKFWIKVFITPFLRRIIWHASSDLEKKDIESYFTLSNVIVIHDGIDVSRFNHQELYSPKELIKYFTKIDFKNVSEVICSIGRLHSIKCFDILIDAFSLYLKDYPYSKLIIAGGNDGVEEGLRRQIKDLDLMDSIFLIGEINIDKIPVLLRNSSSFVLASEFESFGIVVAEALASGLPVLVSDKTSWSDIEKYNCGILAKNKKNDLYNGLLKIKSKEFDSINSINYVKNNFDWKFISEKFYKSFLK